MNAEAVVGVLKVGVVAALAVIPALFLPLPAMSGPQEVDDLRGLLAPDELLRPEAMLGALISIEVDREIEADALVEELGRLSAWRTRRDVALDHLAVLYVDLDLVFNSGDRGEQALQLEDLEERISDAEGRVKILGDRGRALRQRIEASRRRLVALSLRADQLAGMLPAHTDSLTGVWDVRFIPTRESGVFTIFQNGTLITGEYVLDGGWHGSLQGTVVGGKIFLERIDAVKGRFADLSGRIDSAGLGIRGTWNERDLTANRATEGSWVATKRRRGTTAP
ncbi:MAG: hypothetical protein E2P03_03200 [Acidobacteria bacterium]|nr:MAG: hypothetical protein E2P03_03200 [Acidobacteriota bacterium]